MLNAANWTTRLRDLASGARVPGATLAIWSDGQEVLAAYGVLNFATQVPVTTDSLFQVGSITKIWTATMIMQLIDEGLLSLDTTVSEALPGTRLGAGDVGDQVTVRHLLTHTSGIDGDIFTDTGRGDDCVERYVGLLAEAASTFPARAADQPAFGHPDRHPAGGGDPAPGRRRAPQLRYPGRCLGPAAQRRPGRADHRHGRRPAHVRPPPPRWRPR